MKKNFDLKRFQDAIRIAKLGSFFDKLPDREETICGRGRKKNIWGRKTKE